MRSSSKTAVATLTDTILSFQPVGLEDISIIKSYLSHAATRSCDFSVGGILIWKDLFKYEYCVCEDTLFIKSLCEDRSGRQAFLVPVGSLPLYRSIELLKEYCTRCKIPMILTAVPEDLLDEILLFAPLKIKELEGWADYIYDAQALATLSGKHYNKKRNHVNRFIADNPDYTLESISSDNLKEIQDFFSTLGIESIKADEDMADFEWNCCAETLKNYKLYGFEGACLRNNDGKIVAFTIGEVSGDTLILHIEKMEHLVAGAGEAINKLFAERMTLLNPAIRYINREDDAGDPGLRYAKQSYHPSFMLKKFNIEF